jgi:hypothetical protein
MAIALRFVLRDEANCGSVASGGVGVTGLVARPDNYADLLDVGRQSLLNKDAENRLFLSVAIDQGLQGKRTLALPRGGDYSFLDAQRSSSRA